MMSYQIDVAFQLNQHEGVELVTLVLINTPRFIVPVKLVLCYEALKSASSPFIGPSPSTVEPLQTPPLTALFRPSPAISYLYTAVSEHSYFYSIDAQYVTEY